MRFASALIAASLLAASLFQPVLAQSKKELVSKIVSLQSAEVDRIAVTLAQQGPLPQLVAQAGQILRVRVPEDKREATGKAMDEALRTYIKEVQPALRASLVKHAPAVLGGKLEAGFNEAELKQILQAMESPVLRRFNQMTTESQNEWAQKVIQENQGLLKDKLKALDGKLTDLLGLRQAAPAASQ